MLWEIATGLNDEYNILVPIGEDLECAKIFQINGKPIKWAITPKVEPYVAPRRKRQKVRGDIEYLKYHQSRSPDVTLNTAHPLCHLVVSILTRAEARMSLQSARVQLRSNVVSILTRAEARMSL